MGFQGSSIGIYRRVSVSIWGITVEMSPSKLLRDIFQAQQDDEDIDTAMRRM